MNDSHTTPTTRRSILRAATCVAASVAALCAGVPATAFAQAYPNKPVRIVLGLAPGGMNDIVARLLSDQLAVKMGQPVIVENRVGAGGTVGAAYAAKSPPDGYTIFLGAISNMAIAPNQFKNMPYNPLTDFVPITQLASAPNILVANADTPYKTVADVLAAAKSDPSKAMYATAGMGTSPHMAGELFNMMAGVKLPNVPYKGDGPAMADLAGGQLPLGFPALPAAMTFLKAGKLRPIAVTTSKRAASLPDVPTIAETGVPGYEMSAWVGLYAPAGTPPEIVNKINQDVAAVLKTPAARARFAELGLDVVADSPAEFAAFMKTEVEKWAKVAKAAGIKPE